jgi:hypothetical protein
MTLKTERVDVQLDPENQTVVTGQGALFVYWEERAHGWAFLPQTRGA